MSMLPFRHQPGRGRTKYRTGRACAPWVAMLPRHHRGVQGGRRGRAGLGVPAALAGYRAAQPARNDRGGLADPRRDPRIGRRVRLWSRRAGPPRPLKCASGKWGDNQMSSTPTRTRRAHQRSTQPCPIRSTGGRTKGERSNTCGLSSRPTKSRARCRGELPRPDKGHPLTHRERRLPDRRRTPLIFRAFDARPLGHGESQRWVASLRPARHRPRSRSGTALDRPLVNQARGLSATQSTHRASMATIPTECDRECHRSSFDPPMRWSATHDAPTTAWLFRRQAHPIVTAPSSGDSASRVLRMA